MTLEINKPYLVKRVGSEGQTLHYLPWEGFCDGVVLDKPVLAKRVANNAGVLHYLISDQKLENDGTLTIDKPYLAKRVASNNGLLHYLIGGVTCEENPCDRLANRDPAYPTTVYISFDTFALGAGLTFPMALTETASGSMVWQGSQTGGFGTFFASFNCTGSQYYLTVTYGGFYAFGDADPLEDSLDPLVTSFFDSFYSTTWTVAE